MNMHQRQPMLQWVDLVHTLGNTMRRAGFQGSGLAILRILTGYLWYTQLSWKVPWTTPGYNELHKYVAKEAHSAIIPFYRLFISQVVLPHFGFIAYFTYGIETAIAISLFFGVFTRLGGLFGTFWAAQLYIGLSSAPGEWYWTYGMLVMVNAVAWITSSGHWWGIDQWLLPKLARMVKQSRTLKGRCLRWLAHSL